MKKFPRAPAHSRTSRSSWTSRACRALCLSLASLLALSSCAALSDIVDRHETSLYTPVQPQQTDPLFSWENEETPSETETEAETETTPEAVESLPFDPEPAPDAAPGRPEIGSKDPDETDAPETGDAPETSPSQTAPREIGSTPWTSLTPGEDEEREGLFTRAATALLAEQIVRCCVNRTWLDPERLRLTGFDADSVSNFYISTLKYRELADYPAAFDQILDWDETEVKYAVNENGAAIASRFFPGAARSDGGANRYAYDADGFPLSRYDLEELEILSDEVSTVARFRLLSLEGKEPEDCGEYRIFFYNDDPENNRLPRMLFAKKGEAEDEDAADPPMPEWAGELAVPDFLTEEQAELYRRAAVLAAAFSQTDTFVESFPRKDGEPFLDASVYGAVSGEWTIARGRWENYYDFEAMITSVFSWDFWQTLKEPAYRNIGGKLAFAPASTGSLIGHLPEYDLFELIESNEWTTAFRYIAAYEREPGVEDAPLEFVSYPIVFTDTDLGWRVSRFASASCGALGGDADTRRITARRIRPEGAKLLTEQLVRYVMPKSWQENPRSSFENEDALRFLYSLCLYTDREEHPYARYARLAEDRNRYEIAEADARMLAKELFGIDNLAIPDGAFDSVAGCVWIPLGIGLASTDYDCEDLHVSGGDASCSVFFLLRDASPEGGGEDFGNFLFSYTPGAFDRPVLSVRNAE